MEILSCSQNNINALMEEIENYFFCGCSQKEVIKKIFLEEIGNEEDYKIFEKELRVINDKLLKDLDFFFESDPAAENKEVIIAAYPGFKAVTYYRVAHAIYELGNKVAARVISERAHFLTSIDIHPGAEIGCPFFIDHGTGIVIGETAIVGNNVKLYQGVTLGALSLSQGQKLKGTKRHPTIGNNVTIYSNASILGGEVTIGDNVVIGGNVYLTSSIPDNYKVLLPKPELILIKKK